MSILEFSRQIMKRRFRLGHFDCFHLILDYLDFYGVDRPHTFEGYSEEAYADLYQENPKLALQLMQQYIELLLEPINEKDILAGDIVLAQYDTNDPAPGIVVSNGKMLIVTKDGPQVVPLGFYRILEAYRCHKQYLP